MRNGTEETAAGHRCPLEVHNARIGRIHPRSDGRLTPEGRDVILRDAILRDVILRDVILHDVAYQI